jgi:opacity protein-like surface antigen
MYKFILFALLATSGLHASYCMEEPCCIQGGYVTVGGGAVFPMRNSSVTGNTNSVIYFPTIPGTSVFQLTNVNWKTKYKAGYEVNAAAGCSLCSDWKIEGEFLYQNIQRDISGSYDWDEFDAVTGDLFADTINPIRHTSTRTNIYSLLTNLQYDYRTCSCWKVSIGGGVGVAWLQSHGRSRNSELVVDLPTHVPPIHTSAPTIEKSPTLYGTAFAWQVKLGVGYEIFENFDMSINYRLFGTTRFHARSSSITTNPDTAAEFVFTIPEDEIRGLLNSSVNLSLSYGF